MMAVPKVFLATAFLLFASISHLYSQTAGKQACFTEAEVAFDSTAKGIKIAGTLSRPPKGGPHPAVLMITGNGPHTRDQMISDSPLFKMLGEFFASRGFMVLRTDARGFGKSTGPDDWEKYTTADRVEDNRAALSFLRKQAGVDAKRVVLFGHSEGAMIAAALAASGAEPALTILLAPSAKRGDLVHSQQLKDSLLRQGASEETAEAVRTRFLRFSDFLGNDGTDNEEFEKIAVEFLAAHGVAPDKIEPGFAKGLLKGYLTAPWYKYFFTYDPAEDLRRITSPMLAVFAGKDSNVPWRLHIPPLVEAMKIAGNEDFSVGVIPEQDHFFLEFEGKMLEKHRPGEMKIADELYDALEAEIARRGLGSPAC